MITNQDFSMIRGDSKVISVSITDEDNIPLDITGSSLKWVAKRNIKSSAHQILKTTSDDITINDSINGGFQIKINPIDTLRLAGPFYHEVELTDIMGNVSTVLSGTMTINVDGI